MKAGRSLLRARRAQVAVEFALAGVFGIFLLIAFFLFGLHALRLTFMNRATREVGRLCAGAAFLENDVSRRCASEEGISALILSRLPDAMFSASNLTILSRTYDNLAAARNHVPCRNDEGGTEVVTGEGLYTTFEALYDVAGGFEVTLPLSAEAIQLPSTLCTTVLVYREGVLVESLEEEPGEGG